MKKVLVVDDTKNIRMILTKCLELEGYEVTTASDGKQALELFNSHKFDLAFLDIKLPEIRGTEVLRRIREHGIKTPVIIITAYATVKNAIDCTNLGAVAYIQKPFTADRIKTILSEIHNMHHSKAPSDEYEVDAIIALTEEALSKNDYHHAIQMLKTALSIEPGCSKLYLLLGKAYEGIADPINAKKFKTLYEALNSLQE